MLYLSEQAHLALEHHVRSGQGRRERFGSDHLDVDHLEVETYIESYIAPDETAEAMRYSQHKERRDTIVVGWAPTRNRSMRLTAYHRGRQLAASLVASTRVPHPLYPHKSDYAEPEQARLEATEARLVAVAKVLMQARHDYAQARMVDLRTAQTELYTQLSDTEWLVSMGTYYDTVLERRKALRRAGERMDRVVAAADQAWENRARMWKDRLREAGASREPITSEILLEGYDRVDVTPAPAVRRTPAAQCG